MKDGNLKYSMGLPLDLNVGIIRKHSKKGLGTAGVRGRWKGSGLRRACAAGGIRRFTPVSAWERSDGAFSAAECETVVRLKCQDLQDVKSLQIQLA